jgi:phosphoribosylglycinamide formyltransferase 1
LSTPARLAVFVSGRGSNLQALLDHFNGGRSDAARVELVVGSDSGIGAFERARSAGVETCLIDMSHSPNAQATSIITELDAYKIDLVVLAGYVKLVPAAVVDRFRGRILNIHPALLPAFGGSGMYGIRVHRAVIASGARVSGATVHLVDERYDEGGIIAQWPVPVLPNDSPETLAARVLKVEHMLLPAAIEATLGRTGGTASIDGGRSFELSDAAAPSIRSVRRLLFLPSNS